MLTFAHQLQNHYSWGWWECYLQVLSHKPKQWSLEVLEVGGARRSSLIHECLQAVSLCSCNKRPVLESNQCAGILAYLIVHSFSCSRFMALLHPTHLAAKTAIAPDTVQWVATAWAIIQLFKGDMCSVSRPPRLHSQLLLLKCILDVHSERI